MSESLSAARLAEIRARLAKYRAGLCMARTERGPCLREKGHELYNDHVHHRATTIASMSEPWAVMAEDLLAEVERLSAKPERVARWEPMPVGERAFRLVCDHVEIGRYHADGSVYVTTLTDGSFVGRWFAEHMARSHIEIAAAARGWEVEK